MLLHLSILSLPLFWMMLYGLLSDVLMRNVSKYLHRSLLTLRLLFLYPMLCLGTLAS